MCADALLSMLQFSANFVAVNMFKKLSPFMLHVYLAIM